MYWFDEPIAEVGAEVLGAFIDVAVHVPADLQQKFTSTRADVFGIVGRWLNQVHAYDLALAAFREGLMSARKASEDVLAGFIMTGQAGVLMRQGRFDDVERYCVTAAAEYEPKMSEASDTQLAVWGSLLIRASGAAVRNNRSREAEEHLSLARTAGARLGREVLRHTSFGPTTLSAQAMENQMLRDCPDKAIRIAESISGPELDSLNASKRARFKLDCAAASARLGQRDDAMRIMNDLQTEFPERLRHQKQAQRVMHEVISSWKRTLPESARNLADFLRVELRDPSSPYRAL